MPRRREVPKRDVLPDPKFGSQEVSKFVNVLMTGGKKSVAERILYGAFDQVTNKAGKDPLETFSLAISAWSTRAGVVINRLYCAGCLCAGLRGIVQRRA